MEIEAKVDPSHVERIRRALRDHAGTPEVAELLAAIDSAHEHAHRALAGDESASLEHSHLAWARTQLFAPADPLPARARTRVTKAGELAGYGKYEEFDPGWLETLAEYLEHILTAKPRFGESPQCIEIGDRASLAIAGDWATGYWEGDDTAAARIARLMSDADYTIHLGDTYYAGTELQVSDQLTARWPRGKRDCFAVPGNHEMYTKGWPFRKAIHERFPSQQRTTFFALRNAQWLVLALDTAYFAPFMYLDGTLGPDDDAQRAFARGLLAERGARRVILFTHHPPYGLVGPAQKRPLQTHVSRFFEASRMPDGPDYWAWGHLHATAVYAGSEGVPRGRLIGHGAIPFGPASELATIPAIRWYEQKLAGDDRCPQRVLNGFLRLELDGRDAHEAYVAENGETRWSGAF